MTSRGITDGQNPEKLLLLATDSLQACFEEMSGLKQSMRSLCEKHVNKTCASLQEFQVLSFDYLRKIDELLEREADLKEQLTHKDKQSSQLASLLKTSQAMIAGLVK